MAAIRLGLEFMAVAIAPTIYRLTMQLDDKAIMEFEDNNPDQNDTARRGKSSLTAAIRREVKVWRGEWLVLLQGAQG